MDTAAGLQGGQLRGRERCHIMSPTTEKPPSPMVRQPQCPSLWRSAYSLDIRLLKWQWHNASLSNTHSTLPSKTPSNVFKFFHWKECDENARESSNCESYNLQRYLKATSFNPTYLNKGEEEDKDPWGGTVDRRAAPGPRPASGRARLRCRLPESKPSLRYIASHSHTLHHPTQNLKPYSKSSVSLCLWKVPFPKMPHPLRLLNLCWLLPPRELQRVLFLGLLPWDSHHCTGSLFSVHLLNESSFMLGSPTSRTSHILHIQINTHLTLFGEHILLFVLWNIVRETFKLWGLKILLQQCWLVAEIQLDVWSFSRCWEEGTPLLHPQHCR